MTSKRGRPKGDGQNDDRALKAIAEKLVSGEAQAYDEAAAAVYLTHKPTQSHVTKTVKDRWRGKWKVRGEKYLEEARTPIIRYVEGPPVDRLMMTGVEHLKHLRDAQPLQQFEKALKATGLTIGQVRAQHDAIIETLRDPMVRSALDRIQSGEIQAALEAFRKYQA